VGQKYPLTQHFSFSHTNQHYPQENNKRGNAPCPAMLFLQKINAGEHAEQNADLSERKDIT